jgi:hypothetical protein
MGSIPVFYRGGAIVPRRSGVRCCMIAPLACYQGLLKCSGLTVAVAAKALVST